MRFMISAVVLLNLLGYMAVTGNPSGSGHVKSLDKPNSSVSKAFNSNFGHNKGQTELSDPKLDVINPESETKADLEDAASTAERKKRGFWHYHNDDCHHRTCHWHDYGYWAHGYWHPNKKQFCEWVDHCHHHHH